MNETVPTSRSAYPLRLDPELRARAEEEAKRLDRSLHWVLTDALRKSFGLKGAN